MALLESAQISNENRPICSSCVAQCILNEDFESLKKLFIGGVLNTDLFFIPSQDFYDNSRPRSEEMILYEFSESHQCDHIQPLESTQSHQALPLTGVFVPLNLIRIALQKENLEIVMFLFENIKLDLREPLVHGEPANVSEIAEFPGPLIFRDLSISRLSILHWLLLPLYYDIDNALTAKNRLTLNEPIIEVNEFIRFQPDGHIQTEKTKTVISPSRLCSFRYLIMNYEKQLTIKFGEQVCKDCWPLMKM